ncbi:MAG TPA: tol-pal system protein YbgF [Methylomirabilota bacterium]|nr:tol-pal system protein YbgF [Methylomirabilota bacterium]
MKNDCLYLMLLMVLGLAGCVAPQQIDLVEREQRRIRNDQASAQTDLDAIRGSLADTRANVQQMQREVNALKERFEELRVQMGKQLGQSSREGDQRVKNFEGRLAKLEEDSKAQAELLKKRDEELKQLREAGQAAQAEQRAEAAAASERLAEGNMAESEAIRKEYEAAWRSLDKKDYKGALARFKDFLKKYPKSKLAGNAQYWIGECHYALKEFDQAILEFDAVRKYPQSEKVPAALLKQGFAFAELGEKVNARLILQEVIEKYPQSPEAVRAKQRLKTLES